MRLTILGKYPPIEGGVSSRTYWLARALGERGIKVDIVTNAECVEDAYRENINNSDHQVQHEYNPKNVTVFSLRKPAPRHIPYSAGYVTRLTNLGLKVIGERGSDIVYAHYLEPYGVSGLLLKELLGLPLVVRHAGSDIYRLLANEDYSYMLGRVLTKADGVFMSRSLEQLTTEMGISSIPSPQALLDTEHFSPEGETFNFASHGFAFDQKLPIITYIGKIGMNKGIFELLRALEKITQEFKLVMITGGGGEELKKFNNMVTDSPISTKIVNIGFVAPWEIPKLLRSSTLLVHLEYNFPIPIHSPIQPNEAIATGTPLLLSSEMYKKISSRFPKTNRLFSVVDDPSDTEGLANAINSMLSASDLKENAKNIRDEFLKSSTWEAGIEEYIRIFERLSKKKSTFSWLPRR